VLSNAKHDRRKLEELLRGAAAVTPKLVSEVITQACPLLNASNFFQSAIGVRRLIEAQAWTDVALTLIGLEMPQWKLRRLVYDEGEWFCSLSRHWQVPDWLDDAVEAHHEVLPIAILMAFIEAHQMRSAERSLHMVPQVRSESLDSGYPVCCDDFA
jgi:hypothetical protein